MERTNLMNFVCLNCRYCDKRIVTFNRYYAAGREDLLTYCAPCPRCQTQMVYVGKKFKVPRRQDEQGWKKLKWLIHNGWRGFSWPINPRMSKIELKESLRKIKNAKPKARYIPKAKSNRANDTDVL